jgi:hypothetical protein
VLVQQFSFIVIRRTPFFTTWTRRRPGGADFWGTLPLSGSPPQTRYGVSLIKLDIEVYGVTGLMLRWRMRSSRLQNWLGAEVAAEFSAARYFVAF